MCLRNLENANPVEGIQEENRYTEDVPGLLTDLDGADEDSIAD